MSNKPVGETGTMPGTDAWSIAVFPADQVPVGTKLYIAPVNASEGEKQAYLSENERHGWTGRVFGFEGGSLYLDKIGDGKLVFDDNGLSFEPSDDDDPRQYRGAAIANSELIALRDYLTTAFPASSPTVGGGVKCDALRNALDFYADPANWIDSPPFDCDPDCITPKAIPVAYEDGAQICDCGDRARAALSSASAALDVLVERQRQIEIEGWTTEHDDTHDKGELAEAASCYARGSDRINWQAPDPDFPRRKVTTGRVMWPWSPDWWKPSDRRRNLVKAGALIVAEIERLDRLTHIEGA